MKAQFGELAVRLRVLGCSGGELPRHRTTCFLVDGVLAIDAGALTASLPLDQLPQVDDIVLTPQPLRPRQGRAAAGRPGGRAAPHAGPHPRLAGCAAGPAGERLQRPALARLHPHPRPAPAGGPARARSARPTLPRRSAHLVRPVPVCHPVESFGFLVSDGKSRLAISGDTGPTEAFWRAVNAGPPQAALLVRGLLPQRRSRGWPTSPATSRPATLRSELAKLDAGRARCCSTTCKPAYVARAAAGGGRPAPRRASASCARAGPFTF